MGCDQMGDNENAMLPMRPRHRGFNSGKSIQSLLRQLGLNGEVCVRNFWEVHAGRLDEVLHDAGQRHRQLSMQLHPRQAGDDRTAATELHAAWSEIRRRFRQHLNPRLMPLSRQSFAGRIPKGWYARICEYRECRIYFLTRWRIQKHCCSAHRRMEATRRWLDRRSRRIHRACRYRPCGRHFVTSRANKFYHSSRCQIYDGNRRWAKSHRDKARKYNHDSRVRHQAERRSASLAAYHRQHKLNPDKFRRWWRRSYRKKAAREAKRGDSPENGQKIQ